MGSYTPTVPDVVGVNADPSCASLLDGCVRTDYTPRMGTELTNIQLKNLTDAQAKELAVFVAQRGCVFFRDQDWTDEEQIALGAKLGELEEHPDAKAGMKVSANLKEGASPYISFPRCDGDSKEAPGEVFHSDMCEEPTPPTYTVLQMTEVPPFSQSGDTLFANMYAAYDKLSDPMKQLLSGKNAINRRPPAFVGKNESARKHVSSHPVVRTHPLTNWQMLFVNEPFTAHIEGLSFYESKYVLDFLNHHIQRSAEFQTRFNWQKNSVAIWDNRAVQHIAVWDYWPYAREGRRVAVFGGETPYYSPEGRSQADTYAGGKKPPVWNRGQGMRGAKGGTGPRNGN